MFKKSYFVSWVAMSGSDKIEEGSFVFETRKSGVELYKICIEMARGELERENMSKPLIIKSISKI